MFAARINYHENMTEEERQKTILQLEQQVLGDKLGFKNRRQSKKAKCEVCGGELINGDCPEHAVHI